MPDGSVIVVELRRRSVTRVQPDGTKSRRSPSPAGARTALAIGPDGAVYVCNSGGWDVPRAHRAARSRTPSSRRTTPAAASSASISTPATVDGALHRVRRQPAHRTERHRVRRARRHVVHRSRTPRRVACTTSARSTTRSPTARRSARSCSRRESPNGIGLSPDGTRLYAAETHTGRVYAWNVDRARARSSATPAGATGALLCGLPGMQLFDSLGVDSDGNVVVATLVTGALTVISPAGEVLDQALTGDPMTTNVCWGGDDLRTAYVTCSGTGRLRLDALAPPRAEAQLLRCAEVSVPPRSVASAMGPLAGVKIVELAGIGPGPFAGMLLSDMGADIVRVDRAAAGQPGDVRQAEPRAAVPRPALDRRRPEEPRGRRAGAAARRAGRRADRGLPARRHRAPRPRPRRVPRPQPEARLRPHDRLGPGRPDGAGRRPRHQLHRAGRRARALRPRGRQADAADQPRRRLRRRRHVPGVRHRVRHPRGAARRARARWSTPRWSTAPRSS